MALNDQPWWYAQCLANIQSMQPPYNVMCATNHCDNTMVRNYAENYCNCQQPYPNGCTGKNPPSNCCSYSATTPVPILELGCYCCCGCFADKTPIAYEKGGYKAIEDFQIGDMVYVADDITLKKWSQKKVLFSNGAGGPHSQNLILKVSYGTAPDTDYLLVNRSQLFLTPLGLKPAAALVPGRDQLTTGSGATKPVLSLEVGVFKQGLHHIATSVGAATSPDGHLLLAKDIVCGDWALQTGLSKPSTAGLGLVEGMELLPEFGTRAYGEAYPELGATHHLASVSGVAIAQPSIEEFESLEGSATAYVPSTAFAFFTADQSWDLIANAPMFPPASGAGKEIIQYLFKLYGAFYPYIDFFYDERAIYPNGYVFEEYGQLRLVITGGLGRLVDLRIDGLACVIGTLVAATTMGPPKNSLGLSCLGLSSYGCVSGILPIVWTGLQSVPVITTGIAALETVFGYISAQHKGGGDTCMNVSCDCRIQAMRQAFSMMPLPHCAGGGPDAALAVSRASGTVGQPHGSVAVTFNLPVDPTSATELGNYALDPLATSFAAAISKDDPNTVIISADVAAATAYTVTVTGVVSTQQQPLLPNETTASFKTA